MGARNHCSSSWPSPLLVPTSGRCASTWPDNATRALGTSFDQSCLWDQILLSLPGIYCGCFTFRPVNNTNLWGQLEGRNGGGQGAQY